MKHSSLRGWSDNPCHWQAPVDLASRLTANHLCACNPKRCRAFSAVRSDFTLCYTCAQLCSRLDLTANTKITHYGQNYRSRGARGVCRVSRQRYYGLSIDCTILFRDADTSHQRTTNAYRFNASTARASVQRIPLARNNTFSSVLDYRTIQTPLAHNQAQVMASADKMRLELLASLARIPP